MKANKLGIVFVVAVLGLAGIGASYAGFTDQVVIDGTATTGSVDLEAIAYSGTWVWKHHTDLKDGTDSEPLHDMIVHHGWASDEDGDGVADDDPNGFYGNSEYSLEAYAVAYEDGDGDLDTINVEFWQIYPLQNDTYLDDIDNTPINFYQADVLFHYKGKTPARISADPVTDQLSFDYDVGGETYSDWMTPLLQEGYFDAFLYRTDEATLSGDAYSIPDAHYDRDFWFESWINRTGGQVHYCDFLKLDIILDVPQDDEINWVDGNGNGGDWYWNSIPLGFENFQDKAVELTYEIDLIQFDEYDD